MGTGERADLAGATAALQNGEWRDAKAAFEALAGDLETAEILNGLATCCRFLGQLDESLAARERAYRLAKEHGDHEQAAIAAAWLGRDAALPRGEQHIARAWFSTARRALESTDSDLARATVAYYEGQFVLLAELDAPRAGVLGAEAREIGRRIGDLDLEMQGLSLEGLALVAAGQVEAGMRLVEEAAAAVLADSLSGADVSGWICCHLIYACERTADTTRAAEWCRAMRGFCERWEMPGMFGMCRSHYGSVLVSEGRWEEAEQEFAEASRLFAEAAPALGYEALARLCDLRYRQGRLDEVDDLAGLLVDTPLGWLVMPYLAGAAMHRGEVAKARAFLDRYLADVPADDRLVRTTALDIAADVYAADADLESLQRVADELETAAAAAGTARVVVTAAIARARALAQAGNAADAEGALRRAISAPAHGTVPWELGRARLLLAQVLVDQGERDAARAEVESAASAFAALGAAAEADRAREHRRTLISRSAVGEVTERERDVIRLAAQGRTNPEIARELRLSIHTVHRHVANVRTKLGADSKAAMVATALRDGLI